MTIESREVPVNNSIEDIKQRLSTMIPDLHQDTNDIEQLNPLRRIESISKVWKTVEGYLGVPERVIDVGAGFGYGVVFLKTQGLKVVGIEKVGAKIQQGQELFERVGVDILLSDEVDWDVTPSIVQQDFNSLKADPTADLITMFYVSGELVSNTQTLDTCKKLLKPGGKILISTEMSSEKVTQWAKANRVEYQYQIVEIPGNFEKTAIIIS